MLISSRGRKKVMRERDTCAAGWTIAEVAKSFSFCFSLIICLYHKYKYKYERKDRVHVSQNVFLQLFSQRFLT